MDLILGEYGSLIVEMFVASVLVAAIGIFLLPELTTTFNTLLDSLI